MSYDFKTLSSADFEDLARDLVGAELGIRFEGFGPGPDGGIDGRHSRAGEHIVLQAKHKAGSNFSSLKSVMKRERRAIDRLEPSRYLLATSQPLTPNSTAKLSEVIGPALKATADIYGHTALNDLIRKFPKIERAHIKLWLSSAAVLKRVVNSAVFSHTVASQEEMYEKLSVYAQNPSFAISRDILEKHHVLIVSGPPGVGKTTLAQMLAYAYVGDEWEFIAIRNLDDGFGEIEDSKKQIFFFDDFLGKIRLDRSALASKDAELAQFLRRVQRSKNARFILTTRAYIYEEARRVSENIGDRRLDISKYVLDVSIYTRRVRARILYNHLVASSVPVAHIVALTEGDALPQIIDHKHYNPRIIEWVTDPVLVQDVPPDDFVRHFLHNLDHPTEIWDKAFREHIPQKAQHLLIYLFFCSEWGEPLDDLRTGFERLHSRLCSKFNLPSAPTDFEDAIKLLEGSFIHLQGSTVSYINPSVRDYLNSYLNDASLLAELANASVRANWAQSVWEHYRDLSSEPSISPREFTENFDAVGQRFKDLPSWRSLPGEPNVRSPFDLSLTERCKLLAEWEVSSGCGKFSSSLIGVVSSSRDRFSGWRDGTRLPDLIVSLRSGAASKFDGAIEVAGKLEDKLIEILEDGSCACDDLESIRGDIEIGGDNISEEVLEVLGQVIENEVEAAGDIVGQFDSAAELQDHSEHLISLAEWAGIDPSPAISKIQERFDELRNSDDEPSTASFPSGPVRASDNFDDKELISMFEDLANSQ